MSYQTDIRTKQNKRLGQSRSTTLASALAITVDFNRYELDSFQTGEQNDFPTASTSTDHDYRAIVIGLAISFGKVGGIESVPDCIRRWLWQGAVENCAASLMALDWLYRRAGKQVGCAMAPQDAKTSNRASIAELPIYLDEFEMADRHE